MATLKDVAEEAGLAVSTVSRIINNRGYISDNARKKVEDAMKKLNYQPNELARSLQKKTTNTIGLIVPYINHPYFSRVIHHIERAAYLIGYKVLLFNSYGRDERTRESLEMCLSNRVAGVIICTGNISEELFYDSEIPIIGYERYLKCGEASVECDNREGGIIAAEHLIGKGCKKLLHISDINGEIPMPADDRGIGFRFACEEHKIPYNEVLFNTTDYSEYEYRSILEQAIEENGDVDGIFCNNDVLAARMIPLLKAYHKKVPEDIKLIGFDDGLVAELTSPSLTTIHQPVEEMSNLCVKMIQDIDEGKVVAKRTILPVELVERESTK